MSEIIVLAEQQDGTIAPGTFNAIGAAKIIAERVGAPSTSRWQVTASTAPIHLQAMAPQLFIRWKTRPWQIHSPSLRAGFAQRRSGLRCPICGGAATSIERTAPPRSRAPGCRTSQRRGGHRGQRLRPGLYPPHVGW